MAVNREHQLHDVPAFRAPYLYWCWNGTMEAGEIRSQIAQMRAVGFSECIIHAHPGLRTPFLSDAWFDVVETAVREAARVDMRVWIADDVQKPSGTAGGRITANPDYREHFFAPDGRMLAERDPYRGPCSVDYLNPTCTRAFISLCYQSYRERFTPFFGETIPGFVNHEPRFANPYPWSPALTEKAPEPQCYYQRVGELLVRHHLRPLREWCGSNGVLLTGYGCGAETLGSQVRYQGNAWDVLASYHHPGTSHLGLAAQGHHPRLAASVAHLADTRIVTARLSPGCARPLMPVDLYRLSGWLYANGVTRIQLHGMPSAPAQGFADLSERWTGWGAMPGYLRWAGRVQHFLTRAVPRCRVALYYPLEEFQTAFIPDARHTLNYVDAAPVEDATARALHLAFGELMNALIRRGIDFDIVPRRLLDQVADRLLVVPLSTRLYFRGTALHQGDESADACMDNLERLLGRRTRVTGDGAAPAPQPVSPRLSEPYRHDGDDDGGVWVKEFLFTGAPAVLLWNANATDFTGALHLPELRKWTLWTPADGREEALGRVDNISLRMPPYTITVALG